MQPLPTPQYSSVRLGCLLKCDLLPRITPPWLVFIHQIKLADWSLCFGEDNALWTVGAAEEEIKVASFINSLSSLGFIAALIKNNKRWVCTCGIPCCCYKC